MSVTILTTQTNGIHYIAFIVYMYMFDCEFIMMVPIIYIVMKYKTGHYVYFMHLPSITGSVLLPQLTSLLPILCYILFAVVLMKSFNANKH